MKRFLLPLALFIGLLILLAIGLKRDPRAIPSPLIGKPAPVFDLSQLHTPDRRIRAEDLRGQVWLLNVWASWCGACRNEHPALLDLARRSAVPLIGLNYKDSRGAAQAWLHELGNPYQVSAFDDSGRVGIDYGVYGVPETFVIDRQGIVRFKHIGPLDADLIQNKLLPLLKELDRV